MKAGAQEERTTRAVRSILVPDTSRVKKQPGRCAKGGENDSLSLVASGWFVEAVLVIVKRCWRRENKSRISAVAVAVGWSVGRSSKN